jgi:hypothetical protein
MPGVWSRLKRAFLAFFAILWTGGAPEERPSAAEGDHTERAVQILALFQRDGRLIDFLMEDLGRYSDTDIGAAARDVHAGCRRVLERYVTLGAILTGREQEQVSVAEGFDPAEVRLVGHVSGRPPFQGTLLHRGWRAERVDLPPLPGPASRSVVAPAEVEVA